MQTYELTYIISSQITSEEADSVKKEVESAIQGKEGVIIKSDLPLQPVKTGAQPLAYVISKNSSGYFSTTIFQVEEGKVKEIKENIDKNGKVLRSIIIVKKPIKEMKARRTRKPMLTKEFETVKKPSIMDAILKRTPKNEEKVDTKDLDKKLDELLSE